MFVFYDELLWHGNAEAFWLLLRCWVTGGKDVHIGTSFVCLLASCLFFFKDGQVHSLWLCRLRSWNWNTSFVEMGRKLFGGFMLVRAFKYPHSATLTQCLSQGKKVCNCLKHATKGWQSN